MGNQKSSNYNTGNQESSNYNIGNQELTNYNMDTKYERFTDTDNSQHSKYGQGVDNPAILVSCISLQPPYIEQNSYNEIISDSETDGGTSIPLFHHAPENRQDLDYLKTSSNPDLKIHYLKNKSKMMNKKKSVTMAAEDIQKEEDLPLRRRFSSGDVPEDNIKPMARMLLSPDEGFFLGRADSTARMSNSDVNSECRHRIRITEVAPSHNSILDGDQEWRIPLQQFTSKKHGKKERAKMSRRMRTYYKAQDELIGTYEDIHMEVDEDTDHTEELKKLQETAGLYAKITFLANLVLLAAKMAAAILSGSISIISSLVDSVVDLASGVIIWATGRAVRTRDPYVYPQGRTKLEPIAIVILSVVMSLASVQLIREAIEKIIVLSKGNNELPTFNIPTLVITVSTIVIKLVLWLICRRVKTSMVQVLALDHRNDVLSNSVALICGYVGSAELQSKTDITELKYIDPAGAIVISIYIIFNWWIAGYGQIKMLTGHTAKPDFLKKLTWICVNHHKKIQYVDTVRAFHFGNNFLVEVDIVLPEEMTLKEAHDIGEPLQQKLERLREVERAFVHIDYEYEHDPKDEHKTV